MALQQLQYKSRLPGGDGNPAPTSGVGFLRRVSLTKKLAVIFFLLALAAVGVNFKFMLDLSPDLKGKTGTDVRQDVHGDGAAVGETSVSQHAYRNRMAFLLGTLVVCFGSIIYLFVKKVVVPLNSVEVAARRISRGNLGVALPANPGGEIGALGEAINDLAANYQEVLLLTGATAGNSISAVERIEKMLDQQGQAPNEELREQIRVIRQDLETLSSLVKDFEFYHARFDGRKVVPQIPAPKT
jgi:methyl-accepting chemotaxis protein